MTFVAHSALAEEAPEKASDGTLIAAERAEPAASLESSGASPDIQSAEAPPGPRPAPPAAQGAPPPAPKGAQRKDGSPSLPLVARGDAQMMARDLRGARASYQEAHALDPRAPTPLLRLTECSLALGELEEALQYSELAIRVSPPEGRARLAALSRQAVVFESRGDLDKSLAVYERIAADVPQAKKTEDRTLFEKLARERGRAIETRKKELEASSRVRARVEQELAGPAPKSSAAKP